MECSTQGSAGGRADEQVRVRRREGEQAGAGREWEQKRTGPGPPLDCAFYSEKGGAPWRVVSRVVP